MKKISVCFLFFCLLSSFVYSQDTITVYYDEEWKEISNKDEASFYRKVFSDSNKVWVAHDYYISNKIQMIGSYKSKKIKVKHGHYIYFYENGKKSLEGKYMNDKLGGKWSYWYESGQKKSEGKYLKNKKANEWNYWYESGKPESKEYFKNGLLYSTEGYFENGNLRYSGKYLHGKRQGFWTYWNSEGRITKAGNFKNGMKDGEWVRYFRESMMKIYYNNGVMEGKQLGGIIRRE